MRDLERETGVGRESIRYYIREGLLPEPERPARNVAWYDESFVARVRLIKKLQQERYLPLGVIRTILDGERLPSGGESALFLALAARLGTGAAPPAERLAELARRVGLPAAELRELGAAELLEVATRDGDQWVEGSSIRIAELWGGLRTHGFSDDLGFGPEHARLYVDLVRWLARRELALFAERVTGRVDLERSAAMAELAIPALSEMLAHLHEVVLRRFLAQGNLPEEALPAQPTDRRTG